MTSESRGGCRATALCCTLPSMCWWVFVPTKVCVCVCVFWLGKVIGGSLCGCERKDIDKRSWWQIALHGRKIATKNWVLSVPSRNLVQMQHQLPHFPEPSVNIQCPHTHTHTHTQTRTRTPKWAEHLAHVAADRTTQHPHTPPGVDSVLRMWAERKTGAVCSCRRVQANTLRLISQITFDLPRPPVAAMAITQHAAFEVEKQNIILPSRKAWETQSRFVTWDRGGVVSLLCSYFALYWRAFSMQCTRRLYSHAHTHPLGKENKENCRLLSALALRKLLLLCYQT